MAGQILFASSGEITLVAATAKTCLALKAAANHRVKILSLRVLGKQPAGGTDTPILMRMTQSSANFGTGTSGTIGKRNPSNSETIQTTATKNFTVEPTSPTASGYEWEVQPQAGLIEMLAPGQELDIPGGQSVNFEFTSPGTPIILVCATIDE